MHRFAFGAAVFTAALFLAAGCSPRRQTVVRQIAVAPGVVFYQDDVARVQLLAVDRAVANCRPQVVLQNVMRRRNNFIGDAKTVREWAEQQEALGGVNGGFFGETYDALGRRKQIVGLAASDGHVLAPGGAVVSTRRPGERFLRAAIGFYADGTPQITWATGNQQRGLRAYERVTNPSGGSDWPVTSVVACGPRLFQNGVLRISDQEERLISPGRLSRAFVAYDQVNGTPRHLVLGRANAMTFDEVARFLQKYFRRTYNTRPAEGMCLDGGPSAQIVYREENGQLTDAEPTGVLVPTAILLLPK